MKKMILILSVFTAFAACNTQPKQAVVVVDTLAIKQQALQEEQARVQAEENRKAAEEARLADIRRQERAERRAAITTMNENASLQEPAPAPAKKKGWSDAAKGTAIGVGAGALAGALIDPNHAQGALIGGVVGGGSGYLIGRAKDRKSGRVVKKKPVDQ